MGYHKSTMQLKYVKIIFLSIFSLCTELVLILLFFRQIRDLFPAPEIEENKIIGYSQYFGYPFYFDTFIFFLIIFSIPIIILFFNSIRKYL